MSAHYSTIKEGSWCPACKSLLGIQDNITTKPTPKDCIHFWSRRRDGRQCLRCDKVEFVNPSTSHYETIDVPPKPKKRIEAAPAVYFTNTGMGITQKIYISAVEAKLDFENHGVVITKWPADWDTEKGVWYYEYEEAK